jgi:hypothetical protein
MVQRDLTGGRKRDSNNPMCQERFYYLKIRHHKRSIRPPLQRLNIDRIKLAGKVYKNRKPRVQHTVRTYIEIATAPAG